MLDPETPTVGSQVIAPVKHPDFVPGLLMVRIKQDAMDAVPDLNRLGTRSLSKLRLPDQLEGPLGDLRRKRQIKRVVSVFSRETPVANRIGPTAVAASFAQSVRQAEDPDLAGINLLELSRNADLDKIERDMSRNPAMEYVHRVPARWPTQAVPAASPVDPMINRQWGLRAIQWFNASISADVASIKVAVLDTGVDMRHPDLANSVATYTTDGVSTDDVVGHGTHVCGIIAAQAANDFGVAGICRCQLNVWKIFGDQPAPDGEYYVDALLYQRALNAVRTSGMQVVNLSIGGTQQSQTEELLIGRLISAGITVVAAMGNEFQQGDPQEYPASFQGVVAVGAIDEVNRRAAFSNTGNHISLSAPGTNILSTLPTYPSSARGQDQTLYAAWSGTSMATPHVTATAAVVRARHTQLTPNQIIEKLLATAMKVPGMNGQSQTPEYGAGLLDFRNAVQ